MQEPQWKSNGFTISNAPAKVIEKDSLTSYTLKIDREIQDPSYFENLVLQVDEENEVKAVIFKYILNSEPLPTADGSFILDARVEITPIIYDTSVAGRTTICISYSVLYCNNGIHGGTGPEHPANEKCTSLYWGTKTVCSSDDGGTPINGETPIDGGTSGGGGGTVPTPPCQGRDCPIPIITAPVIDVINEDNCTELKNLLKSSKVGQLNKAPNIKPKLIALKNGINSTGEMGFNMVKSGIYYSNPDVASTNIGHLPIKTGPEIYGGGHTHVIGSGDPMFSWGDVYALYKIYLATAPENRTIAVLTLACMDKQGIKRVYALKIDNFANLEQKLLQDLAQADGNSLEEKKRYILKNKYDEVFNSSLGHYERSFLNYFRDAGISLYETDETINNWSQLSITDSGFDCCSTITKTPCN